DLLSTTERALLRRLSVFAGGFSLDAAEAIYSDTQRPGPELLRDLGRLVDHSLVVAEERGGGTRYRLLETIREYASQQLESSGEAHDYRRRHADWCVQLGVHAEAELRARSQSVWLDRLELEHDNLRAGLAWLSVTEEDGVHALRLAAALWQFWWLRGY